MRAWVDGGLKSWVWISRYGEMGNCRAAVLWPWVFGLGEESNGQQLHGGDGSFGFCGFGDCCREGFVRCELLLCAC